MSINHFSSDLPETLWLNTQQPPTMEQPSSKTPLLFRHPPPSADNRSHNPTFNFNITQDVQPAEFRENDDEEAPKEPMFEKPLTPSDVGKLNRLVIPKQHAEKYFPIGGGGGNGDSVEKGLLLSFEDEAGKSWRFRYSYWNSSQSYVLTKGWSRFVKEKRLDAGDVVMFERHRLDGDRLFIGWRRRAVSQDVVAQGGGGTVGVAGGGGNSGWTRVYYNAQAYPSHPAAGGNGNGTCIPFQPHDCLHAAAGSNVQNNGQTTPSGNPKRSVRLFGVNLECQADDYEHRSSISPHSQSQNISTSNHLPQHHLQDMNMCRDVNQMRYQHQSHFQYHQG